MDAFLTFPEVRRALPCLENTRRSDPNDLHYFKGRFPCGLARNFAGDRFVMVGNAAGLIRAFKGKEVTSAIQTGIRVTQVIVRQGISARAFQACRRQSRHHRRPALRPGDAPPDDPGGALRPAGPSAPGRRTQPGIAPGAL